MDVVILSTSSFPWGMAASSRVRCLAKGMLIEGIRVEYIGLCGANVEYSADKMKVGQVDGIPYSYPGGFAVRPGRWLMRRLDDVFGSCMALLKLLSMRRQGRLDVAVLYTRDSNTVKFWSMFFHLMHVPVVLELCEWPLAIASTRKSGFRKARKFCHETVLLSDAVIPISSYIENEVEQIAASIGKEIPSFRIPILIDRDDSQCLKKLNDNEKEQYLLYAGAISYFDIASMVVDIAAVLQQTGVEMKIKFTGSGPSVMFEKLKSYAAEKGVIHCFNFTGYLSDEDLQSLMRGATALLAPLPDNAQSIARFPTKLGYYLSTGTPVVTNAIGDVELYLQDGVNAFVSPKYDARLLAEKVMQLVESPEKSFVVGERGRTLAYERFHYKSACKGIRKFLESIPTPDAK